MGRRKKKIVENVEILDIGAEGKAITRIENWVVFVPNAIPGDVVDIEIRRKKKSFAEGWAIKFHSYSQKRIQPFCAHYGSCGGCKWQELPYDEQLMYKQKQVTDAFERIGKLAIGEMLPIIPSEKEQYYRNKLEFTFSTRRWFTKEEIASGEEITQMNALGFHVPKLYDRVVDVHHCYLQPEPSNKIRNEIRNFVLEHQYDFYDIRNFSGFMRNIIVRSATTGDLMVIVVFQHEDIEKQNALLEFIKGRFPQITSLMYIINPKMNDTYFDLDVHCYSGNDYIIEKLEDLHFKIGPKSFFQTNPDQGLKLYQITRQFAGLTGNEVVYDLYTGTGTIANFLALNAKKVIGIETIESAIVDAKMNSEQNNINNTSFFAGDVKDILTPTFISNHGKPDILVVDPPRAGIHPSVISTILEMKPGKIVYVSCNPATQARDLAMLNELYNILKVQPVDMFPHTYHIENVALLEMK